MKIGYTGSRHLAGRPVIEAISTLYVAAGLDASECGHVVGDAQGVDATVTTRLRSRGIEPQIEEAEWDRYGKAAGPIRNTEIVAASDVLLAVWDGHSRGTLNCIQTATKNDVPVFVRVLPSGTGCLCQRHR